jgi:cytochrome c oxidase subunit II
MAALRIQEESEVVTARAERRWATVAIVAIVALVGVAGYAGIYKGALPQSRVETADPTTLHLAGEFSEGNLGSALEPDGSVTVRAVGQEYSFTPQCMVVPTDALVTFRATSADVVHGFLIEGTNINTMLVPGYISQLSARFTTTGEHLMPCQEFCGAGHQGMWAKVKVVDRATFMDMAAKARRLSCVE